jgi:hypothetical protein
VPKPTAQLPVRSRSAATPIETTASPDDDYAQRAAQRDLLPRPAEILNQEGVEKGKPVQCAADDRKQRHESRREAACRAAHDGISYMATPQRAGHHAH